MMTWKEFERANADKAFEIATRICQDRRERAMKEFPHSHVMMRTSDIATEMNLILWEWFDDYKREHV